MNISYYNEGGINLQKQPIKYITLEEFVLLVKNNPNIGFYEHLRNLKITDKEQYDKLKKTLPFITPHVEAIGRKLSGDYYDINFRSFTQLMYFDIDDVENVHKEKQRIINQYGDFVSFVCISPSGRGISIIIQIENELTRVNFDMLWLSIRMNEFKDENIDMKATGTGRTMFISSDQDVYYNPNVSLAVDFTIDEKVGNHTNSLGVKITNYINSHISNSNTITKKKYRSYSINEILNTIVTSTPVDVDNEIVDVKEVEDYVSMYIPRIIVDGKKRSTYLIMIHQLFHLNPDLQIDIIYSYIWFINNNFAKPRMEKSQLLRHFNNVVDEIHKTKMVSVNYRTRSIHWNRNCQFLSCIDKKAIAKRLVGLHTRYKNQNSVFEAIDRLGVEGKKITNKAIKEITGKDIKTIRNYRDKPLIDLEVEIKVILDDLIPQNPINMCA
jgi:hypothetical protein